MIKFFGLIMNSNENNTQENKIPPHYEEDEEGLTEPDYEDNRIDIINEVEEDELEEEYTENDQGFLEFPNTSGSNDDYLHKRVHRSHTTTTTIK